MTLHKSKLGRHSRAILLERDFMRLYSEWQETRDSALQRRVFSSLGKLLKNEPGFDFRAKLWQAM